MVRLPSPTARPAARGPCSPWTITLSGTGAAAPPPAPGANLAPATTNFGNQSQGTTSAPQIVTVTNSGSATLTVTGVTVTGTNPGDFNQTSSCGNIAPGFGCQVSVTFTPTATGARTATLSVSDNATGSPHTSTLMGTGTPGATPTVSLNPTSLSFQNQPLNTASGVKTVTVKNTGAGNLNITNITVNNTVGKDFTESDTCRTGPITTNSTCTISVVFTPTSTVDQTATISITDNASNSPQSISLSGNGAAPAVSILPSTTLTFPSTKVGNSSVLQLTLQNSGNATLTGLSMLVSEGSATEFSVANGCGASVAVGAQCTITVTFKPSATGARSADLIITDNAGDSPQVVEMSGTGM